ncbi:uncharacterized protein THITE_128078 [Thermothielavioides terrestris NRRL 8126]|uniref:Uncharacterized protein n=1 Tax=Thermothielavioides terrestris (strain ATCC 38088 / NRRL 8126) TaxID=578455 RepID=G2R5X0_THETT|nr:uncharacterized protein THITE_128078 [Thermothielavioides terrestris NRRL 8126]AEO68357.1 hypothetical protein THITE_128078 [Thermothielavioides terrestris NRRL 8126]
MGAGLLFTDGHHGDVLMNEKRTSIGYGTLLPSPVTHPSPTAARAERPDVPPPLVTTVPARRPESPMSPFEVSPMSPGFPQTPPPTVPRRSSQDSVGGISIASSGVFSPSLLSWPMPPSAAPSAGTSPPTTSHGNVADLAARYKPMTPTKPTTPMKPVAPPTPSNWKKPADWD